MTLRNKLFVISRVVSAIVISLILGSVWWRLSPDAGFSKFGMLLFSALQVREIALFMQQQCFSL